LPAASRTSGDLDPVIDAVANQVHERITDLLEHGLVELGVAPGHLELDLLAEPLRQIPNHSRKATEDEADRHHAHAHDALLQLAHTAFELRRTLCAGAHPSGPEGEAS
jgi:hypothetical protein